MGTSPTQNVAVVGAGIAGLACARTLAQGGKRVTLFEKGLSPGGRMSSIDSPFGSFDAGAQYFTVRDERFRKALATAPGTIKPWAANAVRVLDPHGRVAEAALPTHESHWVGTPTMDAFSRQWAEPLARAGRIEYGTRVTRIERDALHREQWQLHTAGLGDAVHVYSGFDAVVLAIPHPMAGGLLSASQLEPRFAAELQDLVTAPCWSLMIAFPQAVQPGLTRFGPQWNAALSTHHRIAWLARESSKPGRDAIERWTVQASAAWSQEHIDDDAPRVQAKLLKAFGEITGVHAEPSFAQLQRWRWAKTMKPLGHSYALDAKLGIAACGDWCLGHRAEHAFISGLELALALLKR